MNNKCCLPDFIAASLSDATPPDLPLLREDWAGMAFDRNLYEDFAPNDVWVAWLKVLSEHFADIAMCAVRCSECSDGEAWKLSEVWMACAPTGWQMGTSCVIIFCSRVIVAGL